MFLLAFSQPLGGGDRERHARGSAGEGLWRPCVLPICLISLQVLTVRQRKGSLVSQSLTEVCACTHTQGPDLRLTLFGA